MPVSKHGPVKHMTVAEYEAAKREAIRASHAAQPAPVPAAPPVAVTDMSPEEYAASKPVRVSELSNADYYARKAMLIQGDRRR